MPRTLSASVAEFLRANTPPHISADAWQPSGSDVDSYEYQMYGGTDDEHDELRKLVTAFVLGWRMCRLAQQDEDRNTIKLRDIIAPR